MNWSELLLYVLEAVASLAITTIFSVLIPYLIKKHAAEEMQGNLNSLNDIVTKCAKSVYQTYVEAIKGTNAWNKETQRIALNECLKLINNELPKSLYDWLKKNTPNIQNYLINLIEKSIYDLKKGE